MGAVRPWLRYAAPDIQVGSIIAPRERPDDHYKVHTIHEFRGEKWAWGSKTVNGQGIGLDLPFTELLLITETAKPKRKR